MGLLNTDYDIVLARMTATRIRIPWEENEKFKCIIHLYDTVNKAGT